MLLSALKLTTRDVGQASIELMTSPLSEWVMHQFLQQLDRLVKRGLRFDYQRVQEEQRFLRGRLDVEKQLRQPPGRSHFFQIEHDVFLPDRPENRLLRSALTRVCKAAQTPENWRLAHELAVVLAEVPQSTRIEADFKCWRADRLMAHYQPVRPWCELVLGEHMPTALKGTSLGISLLFPMEKLFQEHVANILSLALGPAARLDRQVASQHLCQHQNKGFFRLQPDLVVTLADQMWVLDTKWKVLSSSTELGEDTSRSRYGLSQSDFYQLFAYGHRYLRGKGHLFLVYPQTKNFTAALAPFRFSDDLVLWVVPFDLDRDLLVDTPGGLPVSWAGAGSITHGAWQDDLPSGTHATGSIEAQAA
jgi:5-methylcytosine-specific restriction enzyme subunit McrC